MIQDIGTHLRVEQQCQTVSYLCLERRVLGKVLEYLKQVNANIENSILIIVQIILKVTDLKQPF